MHSQILAIVYPVQNVSDSFSSPSSPLPGPKNLTHAFLTLSSRFPHACSRLLTLFLYLSRAPVRLYASFLRLQGRFRSFGLVPTLSSRDRNLLSLEEVLKPSTRLVHRPRTPLASLACPPLWTPSPHPAYLPLLIFKSVSLILVAGTA